jgi:hypothetical protein
MVLSSSAFAGATLASIIASAHTLDGFNLIGGYVGLGLTSLSFLASAVLIRQNLDPLVIQEQAPQVAVQIANALSEVASNHPNIHMFNLSGVSVTQLPPVEMTADQEDPILMTGFGNWDVVGQCLDEYGTNIDAGRNFYHWETLLGISQAANRRDGSFTHPMTRQEVHDIVWFRALVPDAEPLPISALTGQGITSSKPWQDFQRGTHKVVQVGKQWGIEQNGKVLLMEDGSTAVWDSAQEAQKAIDLYYDKTRPAEKETEKKAIEEAVEKERQHILKFWNTHTEVGDWGAKKLPKGQKGTQETTYHPDVVNEYKRVALLLEARVPDEVKALLREHSKGIEKVFPELKGFIYGKGRQHKDFQYSTPDLTTAEKAKERAKHYRTVQREKKGEDEKVPGRPRTPAYYHKETGEVVEPYSSKGKTRMVKLTEQQEKTEAARGLKEKKEKVTEPKKDSERKPYVGAKMKREFLAAGGTETQLKAAKRAYKKGGVTWESLFP